MPAPRWADMKEDEDEEAKELPECLKGLKLIDLPKQEETLEDAWEADSSKRDYGVDHSTNYAKTDVACEDSSAWMWIFDDVDQRRVKTWSKFCRWFSKKAQPHGLWWAEVVPEDPSSIDCFHCQRPVSCHDESCPYQNQTPCGWCNLFPCKHGLICSRKNFSCWFCHKSSTGHCFGNASDTKKYKLDLNGQFQ
ncbi:unnamed protein product [Durusdinium trenchii]|uniref:C3H1-type domain-containing protein n=1 Tax=Durusdinium trenchii TaxID=1381693 RepID=A0ABP0RCE2_9DINO